MAQFTLESWTRQWACSSWNSCSARGKFIGCGLCRGPHHVAGCLRILHGCPLMQYRNNHFLQIRTLRNTGDLRRSPGARKRQSSLWTELDWLWKTPSGFLHLWSPGGCCWLHTQPLWKHGATGQCQTAVKTALSGSLFYQEETESISTEKQTNKVQAMGFYLVCMIESENSWKVE